MIEEVSSATVEGLVESDIRVNRFSLNMLVTWAKRFNHNLKEVPL